jgi:20S proteasome subunit beta 4
MESLIGIVGKDFTLIGADTSAARSIVVFKTTEDKILELDDFKLLAAAGPVGDRYNFCEYVQKNLHLHELRTTVRLDTKAAANWTRNQLATALRKGPFQVNLLLGGFDENKGASLYFLDYMGAMHPMPVAAHGYCSNFVLATLDRHYKPGMDIEEAKELMRKCLKALSERFLLQQPHWKFKVVDKSGIRVIEL